MNWKWIHLFGGCEAGQTRRSEKRKVETWVVRKGERRRSLLFPEKEKQQTKKGNRLKKRRALNESALGAPMKE